MTNRSPLRAISIRQPLPHLILSRIVDVINVKEYTPWRGLLFIHASWIIDMKMYCFYRDAKLKMPGKNSLPKGKLVGTVRLIDCVNKSKNYWFEGPWGLLIDTPMVCPSRSPSAGSLGYLNSTC